MAGSPTIQRSVNLVIQPFRSAGCGSGAAPPAFPPVQGEPECLNTLDMPPELVQSYFAGYILALVALERPSSDPESVSTTTTAAAAAYGARADATILLNGNRVYPRGGLSEADTACLIARELAAIHLGQPGRRLQALRAVDVALAQRLQGPIGNALSTQGKQDAGLFLLSPLQMLLSKATSPDAANPQTATLRKSSSWRVLQRQAPELAAVIDQLGGLNEKLSQRTWRDIDGAIAFALHDRDEVVQKLRREAEAEALPLLARADLDPRPCVALFRSEGPAGAEDGLDKALATATPLFQAIRGRKHPATALPALRFYPAEHRVEAVPSARTPGAQRKGGE